MVPSLMYGRTHFKFQDVTSKWIQKHKKWSCCYAVAMLPFCFPWSLSTRGDHRYVIYDGSWFVCRNNEWTALCFAGNTTSFCEVTKMKRWTKQQFLASAVQVMVLVLCERKQDIQPGKFINIAFLELRAQVDDAAVLRNFHRREESKSTIFHQRSRMSWMNA